MKIFKCALITLFTLGITFSVYAADKTVKQYGKTKILPKTGQTTSYEDYDDGYYEVGSVASPRFVKAWPAPLITISSWTELNNVRNNLTGSFVLTRNLSDADGDYAGIGDSWTPIGSVGYQFKGTFDGNGYTISDLVCSTPGATGRALFGYALEATIRNVGIIDPTILGQIGSAALIYNCTDSNVNDCYVSGGTVEATERGAGGLISVAIKALGSGSDITDCYANTHVTSGTGESGAGGLVAVMSGSGSELKNCYSVGTVTVTAGGFVGGLIGYLEAIPGGATETNNGWYSGCGPANAIGQKVTQYFPFPIMGPANVTYNEADPTVFYVSTHNVYDTTLPNWNFTTTWHENGATYPNLIGNGPTPYPMVYDRTTGLTWVANPAVCIGSGFDFGVAHQWANAITAITAMNTEVYAGYSDWRLPNARELTSIIDYGRNTPCIDTAFFTTVNSFYWSSTTYSGWTVGAWAWDFDYSPALGDAKTNTHYVRPVRGGV